MTNTFTRNQLGLAISCALSLGFVPMTASADTNPPSTTIKAADSGFLTDQRATVVRSNYGLCWRSGSDPAPADSAQCDPNYVAPTLTAAVEPAAKPIVAAPAAPPPAMVATAVRERVTLDADALFDFDKAVLRPAGREALDGFIGQIKGITPETISAVGHTDRFGTDGYNQRLSEQRVAAVKTYLVSKGIDPANVTTEGRGESQPITKTGECTGAKSAKVIACLQPDRRVDVEVIGMRIAQ
jgi:OOP family OmpA-OmpF porin